jgi:hypothetical protein
LYSLVKGNTIHESKMALFFECMLQSARKVLDTGDIVREAIYANYPNTRHFLDGRYSSTAHALLPRR